MLLTKPCSIVLSLLQAWGRVQPPAVCTSTCSHAPQVLPLLRNPKFSALHAPHCKDALSNVEDSLLYSATPLSMANLGSIHKHSHLSCLHHSQVQQPYPSTMQSCPDNSALCSWQAQLFQGITPTHSSLHETAVHMYNPTTGYGNNKITHYYIWFLWLKGFPNFPCLLMP